MAGTFFPIFERYAYDISQSALTQFVLACAAKRSGRSSGSCHISGLAPQNIKNLEGNPVEVTPRETLENLILLIASLHPHAIGVDVDFSPDQSGWITQQDPEFFKFCLHVSNEVQATDLTSAEQQQLQRLGLHELARTPVFLGVKRTVGRASKFWLANAQFSDLAASIHIDPADTMRMQQEIASGESDKPLKTMSFALAQASKLQEHEGNSTLHWLDEHIRENVSENHLAEEFRANSFLVDYTGLRNIREHESYPIPDEKQMEALEQFFRAKSVIEGKIVLIGDGTGAKDKYSVPGQKEAVPGIYLHACAVDTQLHRPLRSTKTYRYLAICCWGDWSWSGLRIRDTII